MIAYLLAGISIIIAFAFHWLMPKTFWKTSLYSAVSIIAVVSLGLLFLPLGLEATHVEIKDWLKAMLPMLAFFSALISIFVGWFLKVARGQR